MQSSTSDSAKPKIPTAKPPTKPEIGKFLEMAYEEVLWPDPITQLAIRKTYTPSFRPTSSGYRFD